MKGNKSKKGKPPRHELSREYTSEKTQSRYSSNMGFHQMEHQMMDRGRGDEGEMPNESLSGDISSNSASLP